MDTLEDGRESRRDLWTDDVLAGRTDRIAAAFDRERGRPPTVLWDPRPDDARAPQIAFLVRTFLQGERGEAVDPVLLRPALGYINLLEPVDGGRDFRYRLYGSCIAEVTGDDLTGRRVSDLWASAHVVDFSVACYRAAMIRGVPLLTVRYPAGAKHVAYWERFAVSYRCVRSGDSRLLVGNVPVEGTIGRASQFAYASGT